MSTLTVVDKREIENIIATAIRLYVLGSPSPIPLEGRASSKDVGLDFSIGGVNTR
jgi:hypothetical protein